MPIPPEHSKFKPGESGNPNGRPKGTRNRSTIAREWLEVQQSIKNPITGQNEILQQQDIMTLALIKKANEGDVNAFKELMDSAYGKLSQTLTHEGNPEQPVVFELDPKFRSQKDIHNSNMA
jgi:hypothetical protein